MDRLLINIRYPFYALPPAGNKIPFRAILGAIKASRQEGHDASLDPIKDYLGNRNLLYLSSGRAALWLILRTLAKLRPDRTEIVIPAYTCPAVASAVLQAGLKPVLCDINLNDFSFLKEKLERKIGKNTLAVVVVHLFGYPGNVKEVKKFCASNKTFLVEDAAQAFGNSDSDSTEEKLGLLGDAGFFSFGRGKPLSLLHGGLAVFRSPEVFHIAQPLYDELEKFNGLRNIKYGISLMGYVFLSSPSFYWVPQSLSFLHLGETQFEPEIDRFQGSFFARSLLLNLLGEIEKEKETRSRNSKWYENQIKKQTVKCAYSKEGFPYLRYPLLMGDRSTRDRVVKKLHSIGCAAMFYPTTLNMLPGLKERLNDPEDYENGRMLADRLITLPVHSRVSKSDLKRISSTIINDAG